jgi:hypothetical protein
MQMADGGGGGAASPIDAIAQSMDMFAGAGASGGFTINETGGKALLQAIQGLRDWIDLNRGDLQFLAAQRKLGNSDAAMAMKPYMVQVASDGQGFLTMLLKFRESLDKAEQGVNAAMKNYRGTDQGSASQFKG